MIRFFLLFVGITISLFTLEITKWGQKYFVEPFTALLANICVFLVRAFDDQVLAQGKVLMSLTNGFAVSIEPGCNGVEAMIILLAAICAFPATWKQRAVGLTIGFFAIQSLNLVRIISLFYMGQYSKTAFDWFHLYLWQALIILDALVVWLFWLRWISKPENRAPKKPASGTPEPIAA
jgi:exosortase H (IPTLxxWG-CTERM-specific)